MNAAWLNKVTVGAILLAAVVAEGEPLGVGAAMPALGEGQVCETCAARGLCRKDFWNE